MSFLSRSKLNLSDNNSSGIFSRIDDRSRRLPVSPNNSDLMGSLEGFRQGIRKQLTEKLKSPTSSTNKFVRVPSPKNTRGLNDRIDLGLDTKTRGSPRRIDSGFGTQSKSSLSTKSSMKQFDFVKDLNKKIEERSSPKRRVSKDVTLLNSLEKKFTLQNSHVIPGYRNSLNKSSKSPLKEYTSNLETRTPNYRKSQLLGTSYLGEKSLNRATKEMKKSLIKILDHTSSPRRQRESPSRLDSDRPYSALSNGWSQLKSSRIQLNNQSPERREDGGKLGNESLKSLSSFVSDSFKNKEKERSKRISLFSGSNEDLRLDGFKRPGMSEKLPLSKIYELQDLVQIADDKEFNNLSQEYVEELVRLSSMIMQKVKSSAYYSRE